MKYLELLFFLFLNETMDTDTHRRELDRFGLFAEFAHAYAFNCTILDCIKFVCVCMIFQMCQLPPLISRLFLSLSLSNPFYVLLLVFNFKQQLFLHRYYVYLIYMFSFSRFLFVISDQF